MTEKHEHEHKPEKMLSINMSMARKKNIKRRIERKGDFDESCRQSIFLHTN